MRTPLAVLCAALSLALLASIADNFWPGSKTLLGFWDCVFTPGPAPFTVRVSGEEAAGAAARGGLRDGDVIDLRKLDAGTRAALLFQGVAGRPYVIPADRSGTSTLAIVRLTTTYEVHAAQKIAVTALFLLSSTLGIACAWLITFRGPRRRESVVLCLMVAAAFSAFLGPSDIAIPFAPATGLQYVVVGLSFTLPSMLAIVLAHRFGAHHIARTVLEALGFIAAVAVLAGYVAAGVGVATLAIDPAPIALGTSFQVANTLPLLFALIVALYATITSERAERSRCAWLTVPLIAGGAGYAISSIGQVWGAPTWEAYMAFGIVGSVTLLLGALAVTYAVIQRRVLDIGFVLNRALVFAGMSAVIVASFVLLEWALGSFLVDASHATGLVANAALALILGLSMSFIHKRVDALVDFVFFHRRHENEQALREFAKASGFITDVDALLDRTIARIRKHTDAINAAILISEEGVYRSKRSFGDDPPLAVDENDDAVISIKATMKAFDPHQVQSTIRSDLVLPMVARGRVMGLIACGRRVSGESYAPDEVDALMVFASGVASAYDALERERAERRRDEDIITELRALRSAIESL